MIAAREGATDDALPQNIPDLMLNYVNLINRNPVPDAPDARAVHRAAQTAAWACLQQTYRPAAARYADVLDSLGGEEPEKLLNYLEQLKLIRVSDAGRERLRFTLDPLAEYLAGLHLVRSHRADETSWNEFLRRADEQEGAPETIRGFLLAVRDCCASKQSEYHVPTFVVTEIERRVGPSGETAANETEQWVTRLRLRLKKGITQERVEAARALGKLKMQPEVVAAVPSLIDALGDSEPTVRRDAARALGDIGAAASVPDLIGMLNGQPPFVQSSAIRALGRIGPQAVAAVPALQTLVREASFDIRREATRALEKIGVLATPDEVETNDTDDEWADVH